jgi:hypothetical protein
MKHLVLAIFALFLCAAATEKDKTEGLLDKDRYWALLIIDEERNIYKYTDAITVRTYKDGKYKIRIESTKKEIKGVLQKGNGVYVMVSGGKIKGRLQVNDSNLLITLIMGKEKFRFVNVIPPEDYK